VAFAPDEIEHKEFVPGIRGYRRSEVRAFLRAVAAEVAKLEQENAELRRHDRRNGSGRRSSDSAPNGELMRVIYELRSEIAEVQTRMGELTATVPTPQLDPDHAGSSAPDAPVQPDVGFVMRTVLDELGDLRLSVARLEKNSRSNQTVV
jgi:DivIVA domain-containing protein